MTGFEEAEGDIIVTLDADHTYPVSSIPDLLDTYHNVDAPFLNTNRLPNANHMPFLNYLGNKGLTWTAKIIHRSKVNDSQSGMWVFDADLADELNLRSDRMPFSQEIKIKAEKAYDIEEELINYRERIGDEEPDRLRDGYRNLRHLFQMLVEKPTVKG